MGTLDKTVGLARRGLPDEFWRDNYNTALSPAEEVRYQTWAARQSKLLGRDLSMDNYDYDTRGLYKDTQGIDLKGGHGTDLYKKPNHPTFSDQSKYHGAPDPWGGTFRGGQWANGPAPVNYSYRPSPDMLANTHSMARLRNYFSKYEPAGVVAPPEKPAKGIAAVLRKIGVR